MRGPRYQFESAASVRSCWARIGIEPADRHPLNLAVQRCPSHLRARTALSYRAQYLLVVNPLHDLAMVHMGR